MKKNRLLVTLCLGFLMAGSLPAQDAVQAKECVILVHGMGRTYRSMENIEQVLLAQDYRVINVDYPSTEKPIETLAQNFVSSAVDECETGGSAAIHFVTHSLGGILVRYFLQDNSIAGLGKIVMLSPPNHGSEVADELVGWSPYLWLMGPPGQQLVTGTEGIVATLRPIPGQIGIITGNVSFDPWFSGLLPGEDDGKVTVASARLEEMQDFLVVDSGHSFIMNNDRVISQILSFLKSGYFDRAD